MAKVAMIVAPERFRDEELFQTREEIEAAGHEVVLASTRAGRCTGSRGGECICTLSRGDLLPEEYAGVVCVGGGGARLLFADQDAIAFAQSMYAGGKVVAAICLAPVILANAGLLTNRRATVAGTEARTIERAGAVYTGPGVTVDGNIVTANAPKASRLFGLTIARMLESPPKP